MQSASWHATSTPRSVRERRVSLAPRVSSRSVACGSVAAIASAGAAPNAKPASQRDQRCSQDRSAVERQLGVARQRGAGEPLQRRQRQQLPAAVLRVHRPSQAARSRTSTCRTIRARPAPSATRTANSRRRESARDSCTPAKFAHATSNTSPALASNTTSGVRVSPTRASRIGTIVERLSDFFADTRACSLGPNAGDFASQPLLR